jgi:hypothetical protein
MDEAIPPSDFLQQNTLGGFFQKMDVVPGYGSASPEEIPEKIVLKICSSTEE